MDEHILVESDSIAHATISESIQSLVPCKPNDSLERNERSRARERKRMRQKEAVNVINSCKLNLFS